MWIRLWTKPFGQQRARAMIMRSKSGKSWVHHYYTKQQQRRDRVIEKLLLKYQPIKPLLCPLGIRIDAYMKVPKSYSRKRREFCLSNAELPVKPPDLDNIVKGFLDRLQKCGYFKDDKQIVALHATKRYSSKPRVEIEIWEVNNAVQ